MTKRPATKSKKESAKAAAKPAARAAKAKAAPRRAAAIAAPTEDKPAKKAASVKEPKEPKVKVSRLLASVGMIINVGMWLERYVIIPIGLSVNRMPFTWRLYVPAVEIFLTIGTISLFLLLYMRLPG